MRLVLIPLLIVACGGGKLTIDGDLGDNPADEGSPDTAVPGDDTGGIVSRDADGDGFTEVDDCDDTDPDVYPGAPETCDGADQDCDGEVDEEAEDATAFYIDVDGDGYGSDEVHACSAPDDGVTTGGDCAEDDPSVNPGAEEVCADGIDNDCDGGPGPCHLIGLIAAEAATGIITGADPEDLVGLAVSGVGDVTGDGRDDLLIGIPASDERTTDAGIAVVMEGPHTSERTTDDSWARFLGEEIGDKAGLSVAPAGYVNEDILADMLIGAPGAAGVGADAGRAYVVLGGSTDTLGLGEAHAIHLGEAAGDRAGYSLARAGDLDGDGQSEFVIGAPWASYPASESGAVYFVSASTSGSHNLATAEGRMTGSAAGEQAGRTVIAGGDLDGDGTNDVLVGAPYHHGGSTGLESGRVYLVTDPPADGPLHEHSIVINGEGDNAYVGLDICAPGDVDGDGNPDLVVGSGNADTAGVDSGEIYVLLGPITGDRSILEADAVIHGESGFDFAGRAMGDAGDFNRDGIADLLVGAPGNDYGEVNAGAAYLLYGPFTDVDSLSRAPAKLYGADLDHLTGEHLGHAGDMDGDGWDDIFIGAPYTDHPEINAGSIYVFSGMSGM